MFEGLRNLFSTFFLFLIKQLFEFARAHVVPWFQTVWDIFPDSLFGGINQGVGFLAQSGAFKVMNYYAPMVFIWDCFLLYVTVLFACRSLRAWKRWVPFG